MAAGRVGEIHRRIDEPDRHLAAAVGEQRIEGWQWRLGMAEPEIKQLNRLTTILLDIFADRMGLGRLKLMSEVSQLLDGKLKGLGRAVLRTGGSVSITEAKAHTEREYAKFDASRKNLRREQADRAIAEIKAAQRAITKKP